MVSLPDTKNSSFKTQSHRGKKKFGGKGLRGPGGGGGRAGQERSRAGWTREAAGRVSHIHTLRVETGHERVLQVAWMSQELFGGGARR